MLLSEIYLIIISIITLISTNSSRELERKTSSFFFSFPNINENVPHSTCFTQPSENKKENINLMFLIYLLEKTRHTKQISFQYQQIVQLHAVWNSLHGLVGFRNWKKKTFEWLEITRWSHQRL